MDYRPQRQRPTPAECKESLAILKAQLGEAKYNTLLPRRIASPSTHCSHALYRISLLSCAIAHQSRPDYIGAQVAGQTTMDAIRYNMPAWYVGEELIEALIRTAPADDMEPGIIQWALPSLTFFLPESAQMKLNFGGRQPLWVTGCIAPVQDHWKPERDGREIAPRILIHVVAELPTEGLTEYHSILRSNQPLKEWAAYPFTLDAITKLGPEDFSEAAERRFAQQMTYLFLSMVMLLSQPNPAAGFIEEGEPTPMKGKPMPKDPTKPEGFDRVWMPAWLGRHYRVRKPPTVVGPTGTHASPVVHWRKGHMHTYLTGAGRTTRTPRWIEPCLVAAPKDDQPE